MTRESLIRDAEHWVVKIGSSVFLRDDRRVDRPTFASLMRDVDLLGRAGHRVTIVSSGAVALGRERLGWPDDLVDPDISGQQALAALGQSRLMEMYEDELAHYDRGAAQILFSRADLDDRERFLNARRALSRAHDFGAIPIINENDSVATEELRFGDNDRLAAMTCGVEQADVLVILSDVPGILERTPEQGEGLFGNRISRIAVDDPKLDDVAGPTDSDIGTGGMVSKVIAARIAARVGAPTIIAPGKRTGILETLREGRDVGTLIEPAEGDELAGKEVWLGAGARPVGCIRCDEGAREALLHQGASLLPSGVTEVEGEFAEGSVVGIEDESGERLGHGVSVYSADDIRAIAGRQSDDIEETIGERLLDCVVHRDSMVILD